MTPSPEPIRLEGVPPDRFGGDRSRIRRFLTYFNQSMAMNDDTAITTNPLRRRACLLPLLEGPDVESWSELSYDRLNKIRSGGLPLLPETLAWDLLESDLLRVFVDHAECERALGDLKRLPMKDDAIMVLVDGI